MQADKNNVNNWLDLAHAALNVDRNRDVEEYCKKILEVDAKNIKAWMLRARNANRMVKPKEVKEYCKIVLEIDPDNFEALFSIAKLERKVEYYHKAIDAANDSQVQILYEEIKKLAYIEP